MKYTKDKTDTQPARSRTPAPFAELSGCLGFPSRVFIIKDLKSSLHGLVVLPDYALTGLACFSSVEYARAFAKGKRWDLAISDMSFDEAHDLARSKEDVSALMLADKEDDLVIHYVK